MSGSGEWFATLDQGLPAGARIFCFPHAGGNARTFLTWQSRLDGNAELVAVCPPGKAHRASEPRPTFDELVEGAAEAIAASAGEDDRPIYLFGHSLGALVAFEVARKLRGLPSLRHLVASGLMAPSLLPSKRVLELAELEGREFAEALSFFGGLPPELLAEDDVLELLLPGLIADFRMAASYKYHPAAPLMVDVSLVNGREDPHVGEDGVLPWRAECSRPPALHWAEGGHFYFEDDPSVLVRVLLEVVQADQHFELI